MSSRIPNVAAGEADPLDQKIQEERQRIAEDLVRILRKAGYGCHLADDSNAPVSRDDN